MSLLLALAAQTAALPADPLAAAKSCARAATTAHAEKKSPMHVGSEQLFFLMHAARLSSGTDSFPERVGRVTEEIASVQRPSAADAAALVPQCEARFPRPPIDSRAVLPADPFQRDLMCDGILRVLGGVARSIELDGGDAAPFARIQPEIGKISARLTNAELQKRGIREGPQYLKALGTQLEVSIQLGEPVTIAAACGVPGL